MTTQQGSKNFRPFTGTRWAAPALATLLFLTTLGTVAGFGFPLPFDPAGALPESILADAPPASDESTSAWVTDEEAARLIDALGGGPAGVVAYLKHLQATLDDRQELAANVLQLLPTIQTQFIDPVTGLLPQDDTFCPDELAAGNGNGGGFGSDGGVCVTGAQAATYVAGDYAFGTNGPGGGLPGIFIDLGGDDTYTAGDFSFASCDSVCGPALFLDLEGNDTYVGGFYSFGSTSVFIDLHGADSYSAPGGGGNFATYTGSFLDLGGDDVYAPGGLDTNFAASSVTGFDDNLFLDWGGVDAYPSGEVVGSQGTFVDTEGSPDPNQKIVRSGEETPLAQGIPSPITAVDEAPGLDEILEMVPGLDGLADLVPNPIEAPTTFLGYHAQLAFDPPLGLTAAGQTLDFDEMGFVTVTATLFDHAGREKKFEPGPGSDAWLRLDTIDQGGVAGSAPIEGILVTGVVNPSAEHVATFKLHYTDMPILTVVGAPPNDLTGWEFRVESPNEAFQNVEASFNDGSPFPFAMSFYNEAANQAFVPAPRVADALDAMFSPVFFFLDHAPPAITDTSSVAPTTGDAFAVGAVVEDAGVGVESVTADYTVDAATGGSTDLTIALMRAGTTTQFAASPTLASDAVRVTYTFTATDFAGNVASYGPVTLDVIDDDSPTASLDVADATPGNTYLVGDVTLTVTATDNVGIAGVTFRLDGALLLGSVSQAGDDWSLTLPGSALADGSHTLAAFVEDASANEATASTVRSADNSPPTLSDNAPAGWSPTRPLAVSLTATDSTSGVTTIESKKWLSSEPEPASYASGTTVTLATDGTWNLKYRATNGAGVSSTPTTKQVHVDATAPLTTSNAPGQNQRVAAPFTFTLTPTDAASGVAATFYKVWLDGSPEPTAYAAGTTALLSDTGLWHAKFYSTDQAGNQEAPRLVDVDSRALDVVAQIQGVAGNGGWYRSDVSVRLEAVGNGTDPAVIHYAVDGGPEQVYADPFAVTGAGLHAIAYRATAGASPQKEGGLQVQIDAAGPVTDDDAPDGWSRASPLLVQLSALDVGPSGVAATFYRAWAVGDAEPATYDVGSQLSLPTDGEWNLRYYSVDAAGNEEAPRLVRVRLDAREPVVTAKATGAEPTQGWYREAVWFDLTAEDATSGVAALYYTLDEGAELPYTGAVPVADDGRHTVTYRVLDEAGNEAAGLLAIRIDGANPVTTHDAPTGWRTSTPVRVTLAPTDTGSGVYQTYYKVWASAAPEPTTYAIGRAIVFSFNGAWNVKLHSVDMAGNAEPDQSFVVRLDTAPPVTVDDASIGWLTTRPSVVRLSATDTTSGVAQTHYKLWPFGADEPEPYETGTQVTIDSDGVWNLRYRSTDVAGKEGSPTLRQIRIDTVAPATTDNAPTTWARTVPVAVTLAPQDATSGVAATQYKLWRAGAEEPETFLIGTSVAVGQDGVWNLTYRSIDNAGLVGGLVSRQVRADQTIPTQSDNEPLDWQTSLPFTFLVTAQDATSGLASIEHKVWKDDATAPPLFTLGREVRFETGGLYTVQYRSTDFAGNVAPPVTRNLRLDAEPPRTTDNVPEGWSRTFPVVVTLTATEDVSGLEGIYYKLRLPGATDPEAFTKYTGPVSVTAQGESRLTYHAKDLAGHVESLRQSRIRIDSQAPALAWTERPETLVRGENGTLAFALTEAIGLRSVELSVGGALVTPI